MHSTRFDLAVVLTEHARLRMAERNMDAALVLEVIDTRADNLLCVAAVIDNVVVVKTIMHHWEPRP